jgi:F-type H+-transporting ATPase subunit a
MNYYLSLLLQPISKDKIIDIVMRKNLIQHFILSIFVVISFTTNAQHTPSEHTDTKETAWGDLTRDERKKEVKEVIDHHLLDDHDFTITHGVSFPLPVILIDNGVQFFMSSKFHHGETVAEVNGNYYKLFHSKIYKTDAAGTITMDEQHHATNVKPLDLSITKNVFVIMLMALFMFFIFKGVAKAYKTGPMPKGAGRFLEPLVVYIRDEIAIPNIGKKHYKRYMNYLLTVFFFIWFLNLLGMTPFGIGVTNNFAVTTALALCTFFITQFTANKNYWAHIFWMPGVPKPMRIILAPIELLGVFIKPFALTIRLYANMTAGHVVLMSVLGLIFIANSWIAAGPFSVLTLALSLLELLVAALQAYIFTMLTALYFGSAVEEHH